MTRLRSRGGGAQPGGTRAIHANGRHPSFHNAFANQHSPLRSRTLALFEDIVREATRFDGSFGGEPEKSENGRKGATGHYIQLDQPGAVIDAIDTALSALAVPKAPEQK